MESFQQQIDYMNGLLDQLIQTAKKLRDVSLQVISEEELGPLQKQQEEILAQLEAADQEIQRQYRSDMTEIIHQQFSQKLKEFQSLNQEFIDNLNTSHGLIQFELERLSEEELPQKIKRLNQPASHFKTHEQPESED